MSTRAAAPWSDLLDLEQVVAREVLPARVPHYCDLPRDLDPGLRERLESSGITTLYRHQADAFDAAQCGHIAIATGTASGKSLAFNLPVLQTLAADPHARAFYLYPTKALAQDQARSLSRIVPRGVRAAIYDGDTAQPERRAARRDASIFLTNPDMLHASVLPRHSLWGDVLANLAWVVVDEAHVYRGVFGAHVVNVLARLRRLCAAYGAHPRFAVASATIANPGEAAGRLAGSEVEVISHDDSAAAEREIAIWNPPLLDELLGIRASTLGEAATLLAGLVARDVRTIAFAKSRAGCELVYRYAREGLERHAPGKARRLAAYRAGYTPEDRRRIETALVDGTLLGVVATNALELGIDIGGLDCAISVGFPGSASALRQQWGRAGRRREGLGVFIAGEDALDQYFARHPDQLLSRPVEAAVCNPANPAVLSTHLLCAAAEGPLTEDDAAYFGVGCARAGRAASQPRADAAGIRLPRRRQSQPGCVVTHVGAGCRHRRARHGHAAGDGRRGPRTLDGASRRSAPAPGRAVHRHRPRPGGAGGAGTRVQRGVLHAGKAGLEHHDPRSAQRVRAHGHAGGARRHRDARPGGRIPAQTPVRSHRHRRDRARPAGPGVSDRGGVVPAARGCERRSARHAARRRARDDLAAAAAGAVRPRRHRRALHRSAFSDGRAHGVCLRRPSRWRRHRRARLRDVRGVGGAHRGAPA